MTLPPSQLARLAITPGPVDRETAALNRDIIAARLLPLALGGWGYCTLLAAEIHIDNGRLIGPEHSGATLEGTGAGSVLVQSHTGSPYVDNCTLSLHDKAIGFYDQVILHDGPTVTLLATEADLSNYQPGRVCWAWCHHDYHGGPGYPVERHVVQAVDAAARRVTMDSAVSPELTHLKWCAGVPVEDVEAGADEVVMVPGIGMQPVPQVGSTVMVAGGPCVADECAGEFRRVVTTMYGRVLLDRPLTHAWTNAALVFGPFVQGVTIRNLTLAVPTMNGNAPTVFARGCVGLTVDNVHARADVPNRNAVSLTLTTCGYADLRGCDLPDGVGLGTSHDVTLAGGRVGPLAMEEACLNVTLRDGLSHAHQGQHGLHAHTGCERVRVQSHRVEGFGHRGGYAVALGGVPDSELRDVTVRHCGPSGLMLGGDRLRVSGLDAPGLPVAVALGQGVRLTDSRAESWELRAETSGTLAGCEGEHPERAEGWTINGKGRDRDDEDTTADDED